MGQADVFGLGDGQARLRRGLRVTHLGDERLVLDPASGVVHTVRGAAVVALDRILTGQERIDEEVLAAFVASGIVEVPGVTRRQALAISSSALALVASASLPSAVAAASTLSLSGSGGSSAMTAEYTLSDGSTVYRLWDSGVALTATEYTLTLGSARSVEVVLVGAGGSGGAVVTGIGATNRFGGGGGGGEVAFVNLGVVPASTQLRFTIAGTSENASGSASTLEQITGGSSSSTIMTANGGGQGARYSPSEQAAQSGGSGGGGSPTATSGGGVSKNSAQSTANITIGAGTTSYAFAGGSANATYNSAAGGGGSAGAGNSSSDAGSGTGGNGGDGRTLASTSGWTLTGATPDLTAVQQVLGAGGGGGGVSAGGSSNAGPNSSLGAYYDGVRSLSGVEGPVGSGCGGGGAIYWNSSGATAGLGGSGVAWIRISAT